MEVLPMVHELEALAELLRAHAHEKTEGCTFDVTVAQRFPKERSGGRWRTPAARVAVWGLIGGTDDGRADLTFQLAELVFEMTGRWRRDHGLEDCHGPIAVTPSAIEVSEG